MLAGLSSLALLVVLLRMSTGSAANIITAPDQTGTVGLYPSMLLDDTGNPVIAYYRSDNGNLKVMHCDDPNCEPSGNSIESPDTGGTVGINPSLALDHQGYPVVSYYDEDDGNLKLLHCNDPDCDGGNESIETVASSGDVGFYSSLLIDDIHHPKIAYTDSTGIVRLMSCNDDNCDGGNETITTVGAEAQYVSMVPDSAGFPVIAWRNVNPIFDGIWIIHCDDFNCTTHSDETPDPFGTALFPSLKLDSFGYPVVSYKTNFLADLTVLHCNDADCNSATANAPVDTGATGAFSSLEIDDAGNPVVSYYNESTHTLDVVHCNDPDCAGSGDSVTSPDPDTDDIGWYTSLELDASGNPVVAHYNVTLGNLKVLHCDNPDCDPPATATPTASPTATPRLRRRLPGLPHRRQSVRRRHPRLRQRPLGRRLRRPRHQPRRPHPHLSGKRRRRPRLGRRRHRHRQLSGKRRRPPRPGGRTNTDAYADTGRSDADNDSDAT